MTNQTDTAKAEMTEALDAFVRRRPIREGTVVKHGTPYAYRQWRCLCPLCKKAWRDYIREYRHEHVGAPTTPRAEVAVHGTRAKYVGGCRCDECTEANRLYHAERRAAKAAEAKQVLK